LLETFKQQISSLELEPGGGGCYEITVNGDLIYSKLSTGEFPSDELIAEKLSAMT